MSASSSTTLCGKCAVDIAAFIFIFISSLCLPFSQDNLVLCHNRPDDALREWSLLSVTSRPPALLSSVQLLLDVLRGPLPAHHPRRGLCFRGKDPQVVLLNWLGHSDCCRYCLCTSQGQLAGYCQVSFVCRFKDFEFCKHKIQCLHFCVVCFSLYLLVQCFDNLFYVLFANQNVFFFCSCWIDESKYTWILNVPVVMSFVVWFLEFVQIRFQTFTKLFCFYSNMAAEHLLSHQHCSRVDNQTAGGQHCRYSPNEVRTSYAG